MRKIGFRRLVVLCICGSLASILPSHSRAQEKAADPSITVQTTPPSAATYPQIVRIRSLQGDVRVMRGKEAEKATGSIWEKAVAGLPLATGFTLVTGTGRAEIEFEDASTVYLAENSALTFNDVHTTSGVPHTLLALLSGTATMHVQPMAANEFFAIYTPTGGVTARYPEATYVRISSFTDGTELAFQTDLHVRVAGSPVRIVSYTKGQTLVDRGNGNLSLVAAKAPDPLAEWDAWVDARVTERMQAQAAMMKASGLTEPIPGLADMQDRGTFFACEPYGTCWEPKTPKDAEEPDNEPLKAQADATPANSAVDPTEVYERMDFFPCSPDAIRYLMERDRATGEERVLWSEPDASQEGYFGFRDPYDWAVCHAGYWIHRGHRYTWVVGHKRHHRPPVRWVKLDGKKAFVPLHPHDVIGKPPLNLRHGAFEVGEKGRSVQRVSLDPNREVKVLDKVPKEFAKPYFAALAKADEPRVEVHRMNEPLMAARGAGQTLAFDRKSQSFLLTRQVIEGNKTMTRTTPFGGIAGDLQARAEGMNSHGNYSTRPYSGGAGGSSGGGAGARGSSYSGSPAGGSRSGGSSGGGGGFGGSGGGGGSHSSGGGGNTGGGSSSSSGGGGSGHH